MRIFFQKILCSGCVMLLPLGMASRSVIVSWDANRENDLAGYRIYYGTHSADYNRQISVGNVTSHRVDGLEEGRRYFFAVTAVDFSGNESGFSNEVSIEIPQSPPNDPPDNPPNDPPDDSSDPTDNFSDGALGATVYNFPNPFKVGSENTTIRYELNSSGDVTIDILDMDNRLVRTLVRNAFRRTGENLGDTWDGRNSEGNLVANGVYICRIRMGNVQRFIKIAATR